MTNLIKFILVVLALQSFYANSIGIVVVANTDNTDLNIGKRQVRDIFMRSSSEFTLKPVVLKPNSEARLIFNTKVVGLTESRIQSYWAQMQFGGRKKPPIEIESPDTMLEYVKNNKNTVTYLPAHIKIPEGLTVIYRVD
ncbi:hypothetical protein [Paraglaciecola marina]|uniref:hypothetical protein n=1 Tax=Paraglaciecola marina TaxID=2500157 RepID=UPI00106160C7|nr:hypothetical protein [Paraglaciecola marina]